MNLAMQCGIKLVSCLSTKHDWLNNMNRIFSLFYIPDYPLYLRRKKGIIEIC